MQSHLQTFITVLVMHVVDDIEGIHVYSRQPLHHVMEFIHHLIVIKVLACYWAVFRTDLLP